MRSVLIGMLVLMMGLTGCSQKALEADPALAAFLAVLKEEGVDGHLTIHSPLNDDMEYMAVFSISQYTSTRIISIFKCKDEQKAETNFQDSLKNEKLSGQARNGRYLIAATFFPEEPEAVEKIKVLFLAHKFE